MKDEILAALSQLEVQHGCRFLFAAESGSRAWGFASSDSDYDVRAVYVNPLDWYLSTEASPKDTMEAMFPGDLDISAWELRKALRLFAGCNLPLCEWLTSPIRYFAAPGFLEEIQALIPQFFNPVKATHHYLSLAMQAHSSIDGDGTISLKKLFYLLRGTLAAKWCCRFQTMPPVLFTDLLIADLVPQELLTRINGHLEQKRAADEKARTQFSEDLRSFFDSARQDCLEMAAAIKYHSPSRNALDGILRNWVKPRGN